MKLIHFQTKLRIVKLFDCKELDDFQTKLRIVKHFDCKELDDVVSLSLVPTDAHGTTPDNTNRVRHRAVVHQGQLHNRTHVTRM